MTSPMNNFARFDPQQFSWKRVFLLVAAVQLVLIVTLAKGTRYLLLTAATLGWS